MGEISVAFSVVEEKIRTIERELVTNKNIHPNLLAEYRTIISGYYSWMSGEKAELEVARNFWFKENRQFYKSDKACEAEWLGKEDGALYVRMAYALKGLEKLISSLRTQIETATTEYHA